MPLLSGLLCCYGLPHAVVIHCGGNDIGSPENPCGYLIYDIKYTLANIMFHYLPGTAIIWSNILPRLQWRYSSNLVKMDRTRRRINRFARSHLLKRNCYIIQYPDFEDRLPALFNDDGVHLSFIGKDIFINTLQGALETFFANPHIHVYPHY